MVLFQANGQMKKKILRWPPGLHVIKKQNISPEPNRKKHELTRVKLT